MTAKLGSFRLSGPEDSFYAASLQSRISASGLDGQGRMSFRIVRVSERGFAFETSLSPILLAEDKVQLLQTVLSSLFLYLNFAQFFAQHLDHRFVILHCSILDLFQS